MKPSRLFQYHAFQAQKHLSREFFRIAVDIGHSATRDTCGIASEDTRPQELAFGEAIGCVRKLLLRDESEVVVIIEAVLSTYYDLRTGNPQIRGEFERGRGWYYGSGATSLVAVQRFLIEIGESIPQNKTVFLAEAFLSNKPASERGRGSHKRDAQRILANFTSTTWHKLNQGARACSPLLIGIPDVGEFSRARHLR